MKNISLAFILSLIIVIPSAIAQTTYSPDLKGTLRGDHWDAEFISAQLTRKDSSDALMVTKTDGDQVIWLKDFRFENGTIEFDAKGKSGPPQSSFIGIAFRIVDKDTFDAVYFRPFNFRSPNPMNKSHSVQYTSHPSWTWTRLRNEHPGEYENAIDPAPDGDGWFHARIVVHRPDVRVYVNGAYDPSLRVKELSGRRGGSIGIFCNGFGIIANLKIVLEH
ncbi:MAG TPA: hypothetical protein VK470_13185 [Bacteroidota bacterium]|nr:hypothetical protein [Bacteroidota bacterium]